MDTPTSPVIFVVRVVRRDAGSLIGVVERLRTGEKHPFHGTEAIGPIIQRAVGELVVDASPLEESGSPSEQAGP